MLELSRSNGNEAIDEDCDIDGQYFRTDYNQLIHKYYLDKDEYLPKPGTNEYCFLHHTAGREDPYKVVDHWNRDDRGRVATEFVIGGQSHKRGTDKYDGVVVQAFPESGYGWHLGKTGSGYMNRRSVGIEICSTGYLDDEGYTYFKSKAIESQIIELDSPFKKRKYWHKYSDKQIESLRKLILHIADRDNIDVRAGLPALIKEKGAKAFEFNPDAYYGKVKGLWTHTNTRKDKFDMFPQPELLEMLINL